MTLGIGNWWILAEKFEKKLVEKNFIEKNKGNISIYFQYHTNNYHILVYHISLWLYIVAIGTLYIWYIMVNVYYHTIPFQYQYIS